ncbi:MAG: hypothetical protein JW797_01465 [Bradymonadales bacterium]|nr:hypothetical protein [Bradymonadales bacterium]
MAIVKMKKVGVVGPADLKDSFLELLQGAALVDPDSLVETIEPPAELVSRRLALQRVVRTLEQARREAKEEAPPLEEQGELAEAERVIKQVEANLSRRTELENRLALLRKEQQQVAPWGQFEPADLEMLREHDAHLQLYEVTPKQRAGLDLTAVDYHCFVPLKKRGKGMGLLVLTLDRPVELAGLEPMVFPAASLAEIESEIGRIEQEQKQVQQELAELSTRLPGIHRLDKSLEDRLNYATVRAGLGGDEEIFALSGWCPANQLDELERLTTGRPVVLMVSDPLPEDEVPVALKNGRLARMFEPLLKMFNIPHYRELDPTAYIAPFMAVFFGFCLGDMGYGVVLLGIALAVLRRFQPKGEIRTAFKMLAVFGVSAIVIGGSLGNFFGINLYELFDLPTGWLLFQLNEDPTVFFYASLVFGVIQLMLGMTLRLVRQIRREQWQMAVGTLGWLLLMPSIGLGIWMGSALIPIGCGVLILLFASPHRSVARRLGGGAWALYNISGLFGDVMSYVRIFGLGLSSGIIASVVNIIAMSVAGGPPVVGWIFAVIILVVGHTFNFVMALIGSVVHSARLQFLEFFGKFFEGGGRAYSPFKKLQGE